MDIYLFNDYRILLREKLLDYKKNPGKTHSFQKMANFCRIHKTYLSTVLKGDGHLNLDQIFLACEYLGFNEDEHDFTRLLSEQQKSVNQRHKIALDKKIDKIRKKMARTEANIKTEIEETTVRDLSFYYLNPISQLVHMFLTIDRYSEDVGKISGELGISREKLSEVLTNLLRAQIIEFSEGKYKVVKRNIHLPNDSLLFSAHAKLLRLKTIERMESQAENKNYNFSAFFSANEEVQAAIRSAFMEFLKSTKALVEKAEPTRVYQMNFDLLGW